MPDIIKFLQDLGCVLYIDYRSGTFYDWSATGNNGTPTGVIWQNRFLRFPTITSNIVVADNAGIRLTIGAMVWFGDLRDARSGVTERLFSKRDIGGTNWELQLEPSTPRLEFYDGTSTRTLNTSISGKRCVGVSFTSGGTPIGYVDGSSVGNFSGTVTLGAYTAPLYIGNLYSGSANASHAVEAVCLFNTTLTATQHAQVYGYLADKQWSTKPITRSNAKLKINPGETGLVAGWNMKPVGNQIIDQSYNGFSATLYGGASCINTLLGWALQFDGVNDHAFTVNNPFVNADFNTNGCTIAMWFIPVATTGYFFDVQSRLIFRFATNSLVTEVYDSAAAFQQAVSTAALSVGNAYHAVATFQPNGSVLQYLNGVLQATTDTMGTFNIEVAGRPLALGSDYAGANSASIKILTCKVLNTVKDQAWVTSEYNKGKSALFDTDWGAQVSISAVGAGNYIGKTPYRVSSGTFTVTRGTINSKISKALVCASSGIFYSPISEFSQTPTESAYGTWKGSINRSATSTSYIGVISNLAVAPTAGTFNGYSLEISNTGVITLVKRTGGAPTTLVTGPTIASGWIEWKVTRTPAGIFMLYINDTAYGPATDTTYTTSYYQVHDLDTGDQEAYSVRSGDYKLIKGIVV